MIRKKCKESALEYLSKKKGKKGSEIEVKSLKMSEYLLPNDVLTIEEQRNIFEIRNKMSNIPSNFKTEKDSTVKCICGEKESMKHIYICKQIKRTEQVIHYEEVHRDNLKHLKSIGKRFEENMREREKKMKFQEILYCDPLQSVTMDCSNG